MPAYASIFVNVSPLNPCQGIFRIPKSFVDSLPPLLWAASRRPIGSWYCTIWFLNSGSRQNDVWFAEEDEEENDGCWGDCLVFSCYTWNKWWKIDHCCDRRSRRMNIDEKLFDGYMFVYWSLCAVVLFDSVHMMELAENKPQHNRQSFPGLFTLLILSVDPFPEHILCTPKYYLCLW